MFIDMYKFIYNYERWINYFFFCLGKTYVGLKIARALLTNTNMWQTNGQSYPMLVVCYTNHALDQFLEGMYSFYRRLYIQNSKI